MAQFRDIPVDPEARRVRVDLPPGQIAALAVLGARAQLAVAAISRIALGMLAEGRAVTAETVLAEAAEIRAGKPIPPAREKRPRGRPPGKKATDAEPTTPKRRVGRPTKEEAAARPQKPAG